MEVGSRVACRCCISWYACSTVIARAGAIASSAARTTGMGARLMEIAIGLLPGIGGGHRRGRCADPVVLPRLVQAAVDRLPAGPLLLRIPEKVVDVGHLQHQGGVGLGARSGFTVPIERPGVVLFEKRGVADPFDPRRHR